MRSEYFESANSFTYNGINSLDMGLFITGQSAADSAAEPEIETVEVPAKGILIQDNRIDNSVISKYILFLFITCYNYIVN